MTSNVSSIADFDRALRDEYARYVSQFPDQPESVVQRRFAQTGVFPKLGWSLIGIGDAQARSSKDASVLYATIARFIKCAHHCWGPADEQGIHWGGYDFCSLVVPSLYSVLLGKSYLASAFHCGRPMSAQGFGAYKHAANLMVCLECTDWPYREKAVTRARAFVSALGKSRTDIAFVSFFISVLAQDRVAIRDALSTFADGYLASDWGRNKPTTKATFIQAMITYARCYVAEPVDAQTHRTLVSEDRVELWSEMFRILDELLRTPHRFPEPLGFLNDLSTQ